MAVSELNARVKAVERMVGLFKMERQFYLAITLLSLFLLIGAGIYLFITGEDTTAKISALSAMFGSSGLLTYSAGRLLKMWDQALNMLNSSDHSEGE